METISSDVKQFQALESHRKLAIISVLSFVFIIALGVGLYLSNKNLLPNQTSQTAQTAMTTTGDKTIISLSPASQTASIGQTFTIDVVIEKNPAPVTDVVLNYDTSVLELVSVANGEVYDSLITPKTKPQPGEIFIPGGVPPTATTSVSIGVMARVTFKAIKPAGSTEIGFNTAKTIAAKSGVNMLGKTTGTIISVK